METIGLIKIVFFIERAHLSHCMSNYFVLLCMNVRQSVQFKEVSFTLQKSEKSDQEQIVHMILITNLQLKV